MSVLDIPDSLYAEDHLYFYVFNDLFFFHFDVHIMLFMVLRLNFPSPKQIRVQLADGVRVRNEETSITYGI